MGAHWRCGVTATLVGTVRYRYLERQVPQLHARVVRVGPRVHRRQFSVAIPHEEQGADAWRGVAQGRDDRCTRAMAVRWVPEGKRSAAEVEAEDAPLADLVQALAGVVPMQAMHGVAGRVDPGLCERLHTRRGCEDQVGMR